MYWLLDNTLAATPIALIALLAGRFFRRHPSVVHLLWIAVLLRLVLPPMDILFGAADVATAPNGAIFSTQPASATDSAMRWMTRTFGGNWSIWVTVCLGTVWIGGGLAYLVSELGRLRAIRRLVRSSSAAPESTRALAGRLAERLGVQLPPIRMASVASGPFVWSLRRPVLVLPDMPATPALPTVLAHELAHVARRDHWTAWVEFLALILHWWNPLLWLARSRLRAFAELSCDAWVLRLLPSRRIPYAESLLEAAERVSQRALARSVNAFGVDVTGLEFRLRAILHGNPGTAMPGHHPVWLAGVGALLLLTPGWILPPAHTLLPNYPPGVSDDAVLMSRGVSTWEELLLRSEERLAKGTGDAAALQEKGFALMALGRFDEAIAVFAEQAGAGFHPSRAAYNAACAYSRMGDVDAALGQLTLACERGFDRPDSLVADPDLATVRDDIRFAALVESLRRQSRPNPATGSSQAGSVASSP